MVGREEAERRAKEVGVDPATLYRWLQRYKTYEVVTALIPQKRGWKEGKGRIPPYAEEVIEQVIRDFYLSARIQYYPAVRVEGLPRDVSRLS